MSEEKSSFKNCPFCGGTNLKIENSNYDTFVVLCEDCLAQSGRANSHNQAKVLWNMRIE